MTLENLERKLASLRASRSARELSAVAFAQDGDLAAADEHERTAKALQHAIERTLELVESFRVMS